MSTKEEEGIQLLFHGNGDGMQNREKVVSRMVMVGHSNDDAVQMIVNKGRGRHTVVVAWRRRWDAKSEEGGVVDGHSEGNAVQMIVNEKRCRCFKLCTAATYKSRKKGREG